VKLPIARLGERPWNGRPERVRAPYAHTASSVGNDPEYRGARGIPWEAGGTTLQGDIPLATDSAQYREGKVKSTPEGGCQDLKPRAPEQSEPDSVG